MVGEGLSEGATPTDDAHIRTFLIADVRGYTVFTEERGDEAAAELASKFAVVAREGVEARGGTVVELRGDEALAVFDSARQAIRASIELQRMFVDETVADQMLPLAVGIGLDAGEAVAVEGGYRGGALNLAARLCGIAGPAEILASREVVHLARKVDGVAYLDRGSVNLKGLADPVHIIRLSAEADDAAEDMAFRRALGSRAARLAPAVPGSIVANPYKGLRAFEEGDAPDFFGREELVEQLVKRLAQTRFLAVVGPSGSGKSSVVRAGLLPALRRGAIPASEGWRIADMFPGAHPLDGLEAALLRASPDPPPSLMDQLERDQHGLHRAVLRLLPSDGSELVLVIDQFEEVFTLIEDEAARTHFLGSLEAAATDPRSRLRVVATLRADFYDRPLLYRGFAELFKSRVEAVIPLSAEELERAISGPAKRADVTLEPGLVAAMLADVAEEPGALPLMEYALTELFERRDGRVLFREAYREIGGVSGALGRRAEELYADLDDAGKEAARQLFLRLVALGEGTEDTRRRVPRSEVASLEVDRKAMATVLDAFGASRQLSFDRDARTGAPTIELAHEAMLTAWPRLHRWIDDARDDVRTERRVAAAARDWVEADRDPSFLLTGSRLEQVAAWRTGSGLALTPEELEFLDASTSERDRRRTDEEARQARERDLERRSRTRLRALVAALTAAVVVATTLTVIALGQRGRAERQGRVATARELAAASTANLSVDPQLSILLALAAVDATQEDEAVLPEAEQALHHAVEADRELLTLVDPSTGNVAWSPDGRLLLSGGTAGGKEGIDAILWDSQSGEDIQRLSSHTADLNYVAFSPDSTQVVTAADDQKGTFVWDIASGDVRTEIPLAEEGILAGARFAPDGERIVIGELPTGPDGNVVGGIVRVVDVDSGAETLRVDEPWGMCTTPLMSPDGTRIAVARDRTVILDARTGREVLSLDAFCPQEMAYSPDGTRLVTSDDGGVHVWDLRDEGGFDRMPEVRILSPASVIGVDWSSDGDLIATGGGDGVARVFDAETGEEVLALPGHRGLIALVSFSPDGTRLLTGGTDGTARVWDVSRAGTAERLGIEEPIGFSSVEYHPDGDSLLTTEWYGRGWLWDIDTEKLVHGYLDGQRDGTFGPRGDTIAYLTSSDDVLIVRTDDGSVVGRFPTHGDDENWPSALALSGDGSRAAVAGQLGTVSVFDASTGRTLYTLGEPSNARDSMADVAFAPERDLLAGLSGLATLYVWDTSSGEELVRVQSGGGLASSVAFSPDGSKIATAGGYGATVLSASGQELVSMGGVGDVRSVAFSPDGSLLATGSVDGIAYLWDAETGEELLALRGHTGPIWGIAFSPDGSELATASDDGTLRVFTLEVDELVALARSRLSRGLTEVECRQYLHVGRCPDTGASPASPEPPVLPESPVPEGAFRVELEREDFPSPPFGPNDHRFLAGVYTWYLEGDTWRSHRSSKGDVDDWSGTIERSGDRVTFITERGLPECVGYSFSGRLVPDGPSAVRFVDPESIELPGCGDEFPIEGWVQALAAHQWWRVGWTP